MEANGPIANQSVDQSVNQLFNQPIVIDNGSGIIKAGFAGDLAPKCLFPNYVGRPKHVRVMAGAFEGNVLIGPKAEEHRGLLTIKYPMEHGIVRDWDDMERIWQYIYSKEMLQTWPEEHPVLLTEAPLNPLRNREKIAEIFFEILNVPALFISTPAVLGLYATGRTTGVVLDSGDGVSHAVCVHEGYAVPSSIMRDNLAGRDVTRHLRNLLREESRNFRTSAEFEILKTVKEKACYLLRNPQLEDMETNTVLYTLPDGSVLNIGSARFKAAEILFRPDDIGETNKGLHELLMYAILKTDLDLRDVLYSNIVLTGGSTLLTGFKDRFLTEVDKIIPKNLKITITAPHDRLYSTWIGGSILASLDLKKLWISKKEYDEENIRAIHRKMFY